MRMQVYFQGECPKLGDGWRAVSVHVGRKWVMLVSGGTHAKLRLSDWEPIAQHGREIPELLRKRRKRK